jgi:NAD(P)-dependent dehydrogenase (short-subunit alcohol dehydrogenase family)
MANRKVAFITGASRGLRRRIAAHGNTPGSLLV